MKKMIVIIVLLLAPIMALRAEQSTVSGRIINGKGMTIRLMTYSDQVTYLRETLATALIGEDERFQLTVENNAVRYIWLDIEFQQAEMFIQPGQSYDVETELKNLSISNSYYNRTGLQLKIIKDDADNLNLYIQDFNQLYNDFMLGYADNIRAHSSSSMFDTFIKAINLRFQKATNPYFMDYIHYKTASMQLFLRLKGRDNIGLEYFTGKPVLYENIEYMDFFNLFFEKYFLAGGKYFSYNKTYDLVNGNATAADIVDSLRTDPVLKDEELRELLLLEGLKELNNISGFKHDRINSLVEELSISGNTEDIRKIAGNLLVRINRLKPGTHAPDFNLSAVNDKKSYKLDDFGGKYIYLAFFESANPACQSELGLAEELFDEFKDKVAFVAISVDKDQEGLNEYLKKAGLPWLVLHYGGNLELLENYDASTFPHFILINDKGQIVSCPAPSPSENIKKLLGSI